MVSQYDETVKKNWRNSACGPTAAHIVLSHYGKHYSINELYRTLGTTRIGLFTPCLLYNAQKLLGEGWQVKRASIKTVMTELTKQRPVLAKFDRFTSLTPWKPAYYRYHWVVVNSYTIANGRLHFTATSNAKMFNFDYSTNAHALTFVQISPKNEATLY